MNLSESLPDNPANRSARLKYILTILFLMTKTFYLDTCIWRDMYENRLGQKGKPLGEYAYDLIIYILENNYKIIFSDALIHELRKAYKNNEIDEVLNFLFICNVLVKVDITKEEYAESRKLSRERNLPLVDCLNAVQARNHNAIMVSQDKHFSQGLSDIAVVARPQDII